MQVLFQLCQWLNNSHWGTAIRESLWLFPIIETVHVLGIVLLVGTVAIVDLRLLGLAMKNEPVSQVAGQLLPLTWIGCAIMFVSGFLLFLAEASTSYGNTAFRIKLLLLALAGLNPLIFHSTIYKRVSEWDLAITTPKAARAAAICSLSLWSGIIIAGRAIAYF
jgi:hypothetical protein